MTTLRRVNYNGVELTLKQLATATGIGYQCICRRYGKGDREPKLWRPLDCIGGNKGKSRPELRGEVTDREREQLAATREARMTRERRKAARIASLKEARDAELRRPLIDASLLSRREHAEIRDRVKYSGQRCWRTNGAAY
jgi:hypothetical protein